MAVATLHLQGAREIELALSRLDRKVARKLGSKALRAGAKIVLAEAKNLAPQKTGALERSIKVRAGKRRKGYQSIVVGSSTKWYTGKEFYAAFVEFGHRIGKASNSIRRARRHNVNADAIDTRAQVPGVHYMEKAYEATKQAALTKVMDTLTELTTEKP